MSQYQPTTMLKIFRRLFKIAESEAHSAVDKLEDPIKMTEQGLRDLKQKLQASLQSLAEVKALQIRMRQDADAKRDTASSYEKKAILLLQKAQAGELNPADGDRLASEALAKKEAATQEFARLSKDIERQSSLVDQLETSVRQLKSQIGTWEGELTSLKARAKVADATKKINQELAQVDASGTVSMLEKMKLKVAEEEALAQSYSQIVSSTTSVDEEIDKALGAAPSHQLGNSGALAELKMKMGMATLAAPVVTQIKTLPPAVDSE